MILISKHFKKQKIELRLIKYISSLYLTCKFKAILGSNSNCKLCMEEQAKNTNTSPERRFHQQLINTKTD